MPVHTSALNREQRVSRIRMTINQMRDGTERKFPETVVQYMADELVGDARSIEGAAARVISQAAFQRQAISRDFAFEVLRKRFAICPPTRPVTELSDEAVETFRTLWMRNYRVPEIAAKLGVTRDSLSGLARTLNLPAQNTLRFPVAGEVVD